jgi:hypothetical protein
MKPYPMKSVVIDHAEYRYFYTVEKLYSNGEGRYRVFIMDPDAPVVYETVIRTFIAWLPVRVSDYIETRIGVAVPF